MPLGDYLVSVIRTWVATAIGAALAYLALHFDIVLPADAATGLQVGAVALVIGVYYAVVRWLEGRWPGLGRVLLSLGMAKGAPVYRDPAIPQSRDSSIPLR